MCEQFCAEPKAHKNHNFKYKHLTVLNCNCRQQLDWFPLVIDDSEREPGFELGPLGWQVAHQRSYYWTTGSNKKRRYFFLSSAMLIAFLPLPKIHACNVLIRPANCTLCKNTNKYTRRWKLIFLISFSLCLRKLTPVYFTENNFWKEWKKVKSNTQYF